MPQMAPILWLNVFSNFMTMIIVVSAMIFFIATYYDKNNAMYMKTLLPKPWKL